MISLILFGVITLVLGVPTAMWFKTWPEALGRWLPRIVGTESISRGQFRDAVVPKFRSDGPPMAVRLAALGSWILGTMFVPGLMLGLFGLVVMGLGLVSIPGLILAWRLFFLGRPLLLGDPEAAMKARGLARFARVLNYVVLAVTGFAMAVQLSGMLRHSIWRSGTSGLLLTLMVAVYGGVSLTHAALLDRAAKAIEDQEATNRAVLGGLRIELPAMAGGAPMFEGMSEEKSEGMSKEKQRGGLG